MGREKEGEAVRRRVTQETLPWFQLVLTSVNCSALVLTKQALVSRRNLHWSLVFTTLLPLIVSHTNDNRLSMRDTIPTSYLLFSHPSPQLTRPAKRNQSRCASLILDRSSMLNRYLQRTRSQHKAEKTRQRRDKEQGCQSTMVYLYHKFRVVRAV